MKALTLTQPWATLVAIGAKMIETRSWATSFKGDIAIHAAKGFTNADRWTCAREPFRSVLAAAGISSPDELPRGSIVTVATLRWCGATDAPGIQNLLTAIAPPHEEAFGNFAPGRWGFVLGNVRRLVEPVPCRGMLGLWELPSDVEAAVRAQLEAGVA